MKEIEVGEHVRFEDGKIERVTYQLKEFIDEHISKSENNRVEFLGKIKHSKNIIDLIEVGDFVNGYRVISVDYDVTNDTTECIELDLNSNYQYNFISIRQIKTILTKEQFEANCYKVGVEDE